MNRPQLAITSVAEPLQVDGYILWPINVCGGGASATVTAHEGGRCLANILNLAHYPITAVLIEYKQ